MLAYTLLYNPQYDKTLAIGTLGGWGHCTALNFIGHLKNIGRLDFGQKISVDKGQFMLRATKVTSKGQKCVAEDIAELWKNERSQTAS